MTISATPDTLTRAQVTTAFEAWNNSYRQDSSGFYTEAEVAEMEVGTLSEQQTIAIFAYARQTST